jgi:hypothetical protein
MNVAYAFVFVELMLTEEGSGPVRVTWPWSKPLAAVWSDASGPKSSGDSSTRGEQPEMAKLNTRKTMGASPAPLIKSRIHVLQMIG